LKEPSVYRACVLPSPLVTNQLAITPVSLTRGDKQNTKMKALEVIRQPSDIRALLSYDANDNVSFTKGANVSAKELAGLVIDDANAITSGTIRAVNTMRLARQLPPVKVTVGGGDKKLKIESVPAFDFVVEQVREGCKTASTFQNIQGLILCADAVDKNNLKCSPFAFKEAKAFLEKSGVLNPETLKLTGGGKVVELLKSGEAKVNSIRPVIKEAKDKANAKATKEGKPLPFPKGGAPLTNAPATKVEDTLDKVALDMKGLIARIDALWAKGDVDKQRPAIVDSARKIATLAGLLIK
jgi:hypothetical protein